MRTAILLGATIAAAMVMLERPASACGGCFHEPSETTSDITDERMLLSVSTKQTTLYDQIRYAGDPGQFAWVLPIRGTVDVGLSADVLFASVDTLTQTTISPPTPNCPAIPADCRSGSSFNAGAPASDSAGGGVVVTKEENVGPYATVQLHPTTTTDPTAINQWLTDNGFVIPDNVKPTISQYTAEGFDFLALKLRPNAGVKSMRPVRVTSPGASLSLPLRMAAIGTGATVGITIWVVGEGRYEPQNFPFYHIENKDLIWDFANSTSNYKALRAQNESAFPGKGWEIESSISLNQQVVRGVIQSGGQYYGGGYYPNGSTSDATTDYLPSDTKTAEQIRQDDVDALFEGMNGQSIRFTRMRSDISHAAMTTDFLLHASTDQSELSNQRSVVQSVNVQCPIYQSCTVVGYGTPEQANAAQSNSGSETFGCATTKKTSYSDLLLAGVVGIGLILVRRRTRQS